MKKYKKVIPIVIAFIIGISTTVGAATVFNSKDITYSSTATTKKNVKDSLDELYTQASKIGKCPQDEVCISLPQPISIVEIGDYISMTPTITSYTISKDLTGYTSDQTINPSELNLWRVIRKNDDGTVELVSEYVSSKSVYFYGLTGLNKIPSTLSTTCSQYTNNEYVSSTRILNKRTDYNLIKTALGSAAAKSISSSGNSQYWTSTSFTSKEEDYTYYGKTIVDGSGELLEGSSVSLRDYNSLYKEWYEYQVGAGIRPIVTLKATIEVSGGDGKGSSTPYILS